MATASISGLSSGLDTAGIVDQLMQLEAIPQNKLKTTLTTEQSRLKSLQAINAKVAELLTQAKALASGTGWGALTATSSSDKVSVKTTTGTAGGTFTFTVDQTAAAHRLTFNTIAAGSDVVVGGGTTVSLTIGGQTKTLETTDGTLDGLVNALNGANTGVTAAKIKLADNSYRLVVSSANTGEAGSFTLTSGDGSAILGGAAVTLGRDAAITMGTDTIKSSTNAFVGVIPGVDLTVTSAAIGTSVDVEVARDGAAAKDKVKSLIESVNATLAQIDSLTSYNSATKTAGSLSGDTGLRQLRTSLLGSVYPSDGTSMADLGIQTDRTGKLVLDETKLAAAYAADPAAVAARFTSGTVDGFAARIATVADAASNKYTGTITSSITGRTSTIDRIENSIESWDLRLELRRTTLRQRFTALETALSQMNSQSSWLTGQINSLNGSS